MTPDTRVLLLAALVAAHVDAERSTPRTGRRRLAGLTSTVSNRVLEEVDVDAIAQRVDLDALLAQVELNALLARVDVDALLDRVDVDRLLDRVDPDRLLDRVDPDRLLDRVDVDRLLARVDVDALLDRVDVDRLLARADLDAVLADIDIELLVRRAGIPELVAQSTGQAATSALDLARRQLVAVDVGLTHLVQRVLRRDPGALPPGPPLLHADRAGEVQDPPLPVSQARARLEVSGHYAGPVSRLLAFAGDVAAATAGFTAIAVTLSWLIGVVAGVDLDTTQRAGPGWLLALAAWYLLWFWGAVSIAGRTPVMGVVGLRVVTRQGAPIRSGRALLRTLLLSLSVAPLGLGFAVLLLDRDRRALHDILSGSAVVYDWGGRPAEMPAPISRWLRAHGAPSPLSPTDGGS